MKITDINYRFMSAGREYMGALYFRFNDSGNFVFGSVPEELCKRKNRQDIDTSNEVPLPLDGLCMIEQINCWWNRNARGVDVGDYGAAHNMYKAVARAMVKDGYKL